MATDIVLLDDDGQWIDSVPIYGIAHGLLMQKADEHGLGLLLRLLDYYGEAEFEKGEIARLIEEVEYLIPRCGDRELFFLLRSLRELGQLAKAQQRGLVVMPD